MSNLTKLVTTLFSKILTICHNTGFIQLSALDYQPLFGEGPSYSSTDVETGGRDKERAHTRAHIQV